MSLHGTEGHRAAPENDRVDTKEHEWGAREWFESRCVIGGVDAGSYYGYQKYRHKRILRAIGNELTNRTQPFVVELGCGLSVYIDFLQWVTREAAPWFPEARVYRD